MTPTSPPPAPSSVILPDQQDPDYPSSPAPEQTPQTIIDTEPQGFNSKGQIYMTIIAILISAFVAIFMMRKIWFIWKRGKVV
jgi:hypothetical protein